MLSFNDLISDESQLARFLKGSCYHSTFKIWCAARSFICKSIVKDGTILDIGSANGFFFSDAFSIGQISI